MKNHDKEILLAKIDTLRMSLNDNQLDTVVSVIRDLVTSIECVHEEEMGFKPVTK